MGSLDARIARIYTTQTGNKVGDTTPNAPNVAGNPPAANFDLVVEIEAGNAVITGTPYTLTVTAVDDTLAAAAPALNPAIPAQTFSSPPFQNVGLDFVRTETFSIAVPAAAKDHLFHYTAVLHNSNFQILSTQTSEPFLLV